ncbi:MAG: DNRLRE domain-containing protein [Candidatus Aegiribacteria sp.]|nr:DNRLRE domain-containing protein [Candidatus Aegiribacteria sp.]
MLNKVLFLTLLLSCIFVLPAAADQVTLEPDQDAFVCDCVPGVTNPMLGNEYLAQGRYSACYNRTFIMWDLSSIPAGSTIDDAEFRIYCCQFYGAPSGQMVYYRVLEAWSETTVTYLNMPAFTTDGAVFLSSWPTGGSWHTIDVTDFVAGWFTGTDNYGLYCHSTGSTSTSDCAYYSSRVSSPGYRPRLVVTYTPPSAFEQSTWGGLKTLGNNDSESDECTCECFMELPPPCPATEETEITETDTEDDAKSISK